MFAAAGGCDEQRSLHLSPSEQVFEHPLIQAVKIDSTGNAIEGGAIPRPV